MVGLNANIIVRIVRIDAADEYRAMDWAIENCDSTKVVWPSGCHLEAEIAFESPTDAVLFRLAVEDWTPVSECLLSLSGNRLDCNYAVEDARIFIRQQGWSAPEVVLTERLLMRCEFENEGQADAFEVAFRC